MKVQTVYLLLAFSGFIALATSQQHYCGRRLSEALNVLCDGSLVKRSEPRISSTEPTFPWVRAAEAHGLRLRRKRQVVEECCDKGCTVEEMQTYCGY